MLPNAIPCMLGGPLRDPPAVLGLLFAAAPLLLVSFTLDPGCLDEREGESHFTFICALISARSAEVRKKGMGGAERGFGERGGEEGAEDSGTCTLLRGDVNDARGLLR